ncbi:unnamed protein product [Closterium sp. NIES-54]
MMTMKEAQASWKGEAVKAAMDEEIRSLISNGTWELVERSCGVNIMKIWWVLTTKYCIDDTVEREKARLVVKGFTQVYGADYDETYSPVSSYVTLRIFLSIVAVLDLNLRQLDMKNTFLQSKLDRGLYMYQLDYFDDGTGRVCKLQKSLYGLKQSLFLWYRALDGVLLGAGWKKSQADTALYFKFGDGGVTCWRISKTPVSVDTYAKLTFDDDKAQEHEEEEYQQEYRRLAYLADTHDTTLEFGGGPESLELIGHVDADDASDKQNGTSTGDYVFIYGGATVF